MPPNPGEILFLYQETMTVSSPHDHHHGTHKGFESPISRSRFFFEPYIRNIQKTSTNDFFQDKSASGGFTDCLSNMRAIFEVIFTLFRIFFNALPVPQEPSGPFDFEPPLSSLKKPGADLRGDGRFVPAGGGRPHLHQVPPATGGPLDAGFSGRRRTKKNRTKGKIKRAGGKKKTHRTPVRGEEPLSDARGPPIPLTPNFLAG